MSINFYITFVHDYFPSRNILFGNRKIKWPWFLKLEERTFFVCVPDFVFPSRES